MKGSYFGVPNNMLTCMQVLWYASILPYLLNDSQTIFLTIHFSKKTSALRDAKLCCAALYAAVTWETAIFVRSKNGT